MIRLVVTNASGTTLGTLDVQDVTITRVLDGPGTIQVNLPATDDAKRLVAQRRRGQVWQYELAKAPVLIGEGIIVSAGRNGGVIAIDMVDTLQELRDTSVLLNRQFDEDTLQTVADALVALVDGWTVTADDFDTLITARFDGVSVLKALQKIAIQNGLHLRLGDEARALEIGAFGEGSGLILTHLERSPDEAPTYGIISDIRLIEESENVYNWILPIGAGEGEAALTLANSTRDFVESMTGADGRTIYYISDATSVAEYGTIQRTGTFKDIAPIANSTAAKVIAANALADAAYAELQRNATPQKTYSINLKYSPEIIRPGDKVRVLYRGDIRRDDPDDLLDTATYALGDTIDAQFWVTRISENYNAGGDVSIALTVSNIDQLMKDEATVIIGTIEDMQTRNLKPQTYPSSFVYCLYDIVGAGTTDAIFPLKLDNSITDIVRVTLQISTERIKSSTIYAGGPVTGGSADIYGLYDAQYCDRYPTCNVYWWNGSSYELLAEFDVVGTTSSAETVLVDVTDYIRENDLYSTHLFKVRSIDETLSSSPDKQQVTPTGALEYASDVVFGGGQIQAIFTVIAISQAILPT